MSGNEAWWERWDWTKYLEDIEALEAGDQSGAQPVNHLIVDDIQRRMFVFWTGGFAYTDAQMEAMKYAPVDEGQGSEIIFYKGQWQVSWYDTELQEWFMWYNEVDITKTTARNWHPPPDTIHPAPNVWKSGHDFWRLMARPDRYYQWGARVGFWFIEEQSVGSEATGNLVISMSDSRAYRWWNIRGDPKEQYPPVLYNDGAIRWQYKDKVPTRRKYITQPDTLGAMYDWFYQFNQTGSPGSISSFVKNGVLKLKPWGSSVNCDQYANMGGLQYNSPGFGDLYMGAYPDRLPQSGAYESYPPYLEWMANFKSNSALQNMVEMMLSSLPGYIAIDSVWLANFREEYEVGGGDPTEWPEYAQFAPAGDKLFGENESSFELFLKKRGRYDWYFDIRAPYWPSEIARYKAYQLYNEVRTEEEFYTALDLNSLLGTWRRTWYASCGRLSPFMRSYEMGEPSRRDSWSPTDTSYNWYGARSTSYPKLNEFDDRFADIAARSDAYNIEVAGDITGDLKAGWLIHFCTSGENLIYSGQVAWGYVRDIRYDSDSGRTLIKIFEDTTGYSKIGWNREVSLRHDPSGITVDSEGKEWPEFVNVHRVLYECREVMIQAKYKQVSIGIERTSMGWDGNGLDWDQPSAQAVFDEAAGGLWDVYEPDPDEWTGGFDGVLIGRSGASADDFSGYWSWYPYSTWNTVHTWAENAFAVTGDDEAIIATHGNVNVKIQYYNSEAPDPVLGGSPPYFEACRAPCTVGFGSVSLTQGEDPLGEWPVAYHYGFMGCRVQKQGNVHWAMVSIRNGLPNGINTVADSGDTLFCGGEYRFFWDAIVADAFVEVDWDKVPQAVFERNIIEHIDVDTEAPEPDDKPPRPDPPLHGSYPQAYFKYIAEQGEVPEHFEVRISGSISQCEDYEGSDPVKYRAVTKNPAEEHDWSEDPRYDFLCEDISIDDACGYNWQGIDATPTDNPSGTRTRYYLSGCTYVPGDTVRIRNDALHNGKFEVVDSSSTYFDIDDGFYIADTPSSAQVTIVGLGIRQETWANYWVSDIEVAPQAKDSAVPQANLTERGEYEQVTEPENWPEDVYDDAVDDAYKPPD